MNIEYSPLVSCIMNVFIYFVLIDRFLVLSLSYMYIFYVSMPLCRTGVLISLFDFSTGIWVKIGPLCFLLVVNGN